MTFQTNPTTDLLAGAKWAFTTRRVNKSDAVGLSKDYDSAVAGDLVLCQILEIGQHKNIQLSDRRNSASYPGDIVVLCLGDRYAPDQFLCRAEIKDGPMDLVAGGGLVGIVEKSHKKMSRPTSVLPLGLLTNTTGQVMNIANYALPPKAPNNDITVIGVFGASMNSGKTTAAASLAHGLRRAGYCVAGIKATGTGAFGDFNAFADAGARSRSVRLVQATPDSSSCPARYCRRASLDRGSGEAAWTQVPTDRDDGVRAPPVDDV